MFHLMRNPNHARVKVVLFVCCFPLVAHGDLVRFSIVADNRGAPGLADTLRQIKEVAGGPGQFIITVGDSDPLATTQGQIEAAFGKGFTWYPVIGNHEVDTEADRAFLLRYYREHLEGKVKPGPEGTAELTYSFDAGPVHLTVLNQYWDGKSAGGSGFALDGDVVPQLAAWLAEDLGATRKPHRLVFGHEPAYPRPDAQYGDWRHVGDSLDHSPQRRDAFWQVLERHGVEAYVHGHVHRYSKFKPPGSTVWQLDAGQARGCGPYDTFLIVKGDETALVIEVYRSLEQPTYTLLETIELGPRVTSRLVEFQQGAGGYQHAVDTMLREHEPSTGYGRAAELSVDRDTPAFSGKRAQVLLRFDQIMGGQGEQIPAGARIREASLLLYGTSKLRYGEVRLHRMLKSWSETSTFADLTDGVSADDSEAVSGFDAVFLGGNPQDDVWHELDVTASVRAWVEQGQANYGWVFLTGSRDGWSFGSSESKTPPCLRVRYEVP